MTIVRITTPFRYRGKEFKEGVTYDLDDGLVAGFVDHWIKRRGHGEVVTDKKIKGELDPRLEFEDDEPVAAEEPVSEADEADAATPPGESVEEASEAQPGSPSQAVPGADVVEEPNVTTSAHFSGTAPGDTPARPSLEEMTKEAEGEHTKKKGKGK